jgi:hypothetical protein
MAKANKKGRTENEAFIRLHRGVTGGAAWRSLTCEARALLIAVWERHNGANNGEIGFSHRQAREALHVGSRKIVAAFAELQDKGFLVAHTKGAFTWKDGAGAGKSTEWEITAEACKGKPPKHLYKSWQNQNTAPKAGTNGTQGERRSIVEEAILEANRTQGERRFARSQDTNGTRGGHTYTMPGEREISGAGLRSKNWRN